MFQIIIPVFGGMAVGIALSGGSPYLLIPGFILIILHGIRELALISLLDEHFAKE